MDNKAVRHTQPPWWVEGQMIVSKFCPVAHCVSCITADVRLIAAAPEMAMALRAVVDWFDNDPDSQNVILRDRLEAVLAKAGA
jgi:hypothetical protein